MSSFKLTANLCCFISFLFYFLICHRFAQLTVSARGTLTS